MKLWKYSGRFLTVTGVIHTTIHRERCIFGNVRKGIGKLCRGKLQPGICFLVLNLRNNTHPLGRNTSVLHQQRTETGTCIFRLRYFIVHHNRLHY